MAVSEVEQSIIRKGRYKYVHNKNIGPPEAIDVYSVFIRRGGGALWLCTYALLFGFICFPILLLLQDATSVFRLLMLDQPVAILYWSFALAGFLARKLLIKQVEKGKELEIWDLVPQNNESVLIFPAFGVQLETVYRSGRTEHKFIPICKILKPVLNECVTPVTCYWSLSLILRGEEELLLVFKSLYPPFTMLIPIWRALCSVIDDKECTEIHPDCDTR